MLDGPEGEGRGYDEREANDSLPGHSGRGQGGRLANERSSRQVRRSMAIEPPQRHADPSLTSASSAFTDHLKEATPLIIQENQVAR